MGAKQQAMIFDSFWCLTNISFYIYLQLNKKKKRTLKFNLESTTISQFVMNQTFKSHTYSKLV